MDDPTATARSVVAWVEAQEPGRVSAALDQHVQAFTPSDDTFDTVMGSVYRSTAPASVALQTALPGLLYRAMNTLADAVGWTEAQRRLRVVQSMAQRQQ